ncbi:transposon Tf2-9 polyprotein [Trichonephila clavipes]|nr:transposon Tf2-9 polyprotein [Trichonephila clavipes]
MRTKQDLEILKLLEEEIVEIFIENRGKIREETKRNILKMQEENCRNFDKKRKKAYQYKIGDIVAIQRTQFGIGLKLKPKFFGPYEVVKVKPKDRYDVRKIGLHEGPTTAADHTKIFSSGLHGKKRTKYRCGQRTVKLVVVNRHPIEYLNKTTVFARRRS